MIATTKQTQTRRLKMAERAQQQMEVLFPDFAPEWIWLRIPANVNTHTG